MTVNIGKNVEGSGRGLRESPVSMIGSPADVPSRYPVYEGEQ
jgi:hypothetical protein